MNAKQLVDCMGCSDARAQLYIAHLNEAMACYDIDKPLRLAAFLATIGHESGLLTITEENLNYSAAGLRAIFPKHFTEAEAADYARHPERIGNRAYCDRMGNGNEASGDGWRFRGRGLIQLTGLGSYRACGHGLGLDLEGSPDLVKDPHVAALSAGWEWDSKGCNAAADLENFELVTRKINGGLNGLEARKEIYARARKALGV